MQKLAIALEEETAMIDFVELECANDLEDLAAAPPVPEPPAVAVGLDPTSTALVAMPLSTEEMQIAMQGADEFTLNELEKV